MYYTDYKENISTALLLAAGTGSRLRPLTNDIPKCLARVNEAPILEHLVQCLHQYGFKRLVVVVGYLEQSIRDLLDEIAVEASKSLFNVMAQQCASLTNVTPIHGDVFLFEPEEPYSMVFLGGMLMYLNESDVIALLRKLIPFIEAGGVILMSGNYCSAGDCHARRNLSGCISLCTNVH